MASQKHIHRYVRINGVWCCDLGDCSHFMPTNVRGGTVDGRASYCHGCGGTFTITQQLMGLEAGKDWHDQPDYKVLCAQCALAEGQPIFTDDMIEEMEKGNATD